MSGRRQGYKRIRGPIFDSMRNQNTEPKKILVWTPGTQSIRQAKRNLRNKARAIVDSRDPLIISVGDRVIRAVCEEPDPEFSALHLFCAAMDAADDTGESWVTCMTYLMDKFEGKVQEPHGEAEPEQPKRTSRLSQLLRALVPRPLRARNETTPEGYINQSLGDEHGELTPGKRVDTPIRDYQGPGATTEGSAGLVYSRREGRS